MDILVIGTGMYVSGRGTEGFGTIMPSIIEWKRNGGDLNSIYMVGTNRKRSLEAFYKVEMLQKLAGVNVDLEVYPKIEDQNLFAYRKVLNFINKPACAIVAVPDHLHFEITKDCLNAGLHTLVVKPLTALISEAKSLIELAKKHNL